MDRYSKLPFPGVSIGEPAGFSCQDDVTEPRFCYQGMSVQALGSACSVYFSQSNANQRNVHSIEPLNECRVASLMQDDPDDIDGLDLPIDPESLLDDYALGNSEVTSVDDVLFPTQGSYLCDQLFVLGEEPDTWEPTPSSGLNQNHHLTDLPAELANRQDSPPVFVVNPLNRQQATSKQPMKSAEMVDNKSAQNEHKNQRQRERYRNDSDYAERRRARQRERLRERRKDPAFAKRERESEMERRKDPAYAERRRACQRVWHRERRKDPATAKRERDYSRERRKDPAYAERQRQRRRERYRNEPNYAERERERRRKCHSNLAFAERKIKLKKGTPPG